MLTLKRSQGIKVPAPPGRGGSVTVTVTVAPFTLGDTRLTVKSAKRTYH